MATPARARGSAGATRSRGEREPGRPTLVCSASAISSNDQPNTWWRTTASRSGGLNWARASSRRLARAGSRRSGSTASASATHCASFSRSRRRWRSWSRAALAAMANNQGRNEPLRESGPASAPPRGMWLGRRHPRRRAPPASWPRRRAPPERVARTARRTPARRPGRTDSSALRWWARPSGLDARASCRRLRDGSAADGMGRGWSR